jgi:hypothetical protein
LNQCSQALKEFERKFVSEMENVARNWKDERQRDFYAKYMNSMSDHLKDCDRSFNQMVMQVRSIENELNRFK